MANPVGNSCWPVSRSEIESHPKARLQVDVTEDEVTAALVGAGWYLTNIVDVLRVGIKAYRDDVERRRLFVKALRDWKNPDEPATLRGLMGLHDQPTTEKK